MSEPRLSDIRPLTGAEFEQIRTLAREKFGLDLREGKEQLVSARLGKHLRRLGFQTFRQYASYVEADSSGTALTEMIDALTTNFTSFLREPAHFELLRKTILPACGGRTPLSIWSAACATGEEPYSIAISVCEELGNRAYTGVKILATDISTRALDTARQAVYSSEKLSGLGAQMLQKYFIKGEQRWEGWYRLNKHVRQMIEFRRLNLTEPLPSLPRFVVIFCRNVMIYFGRETQERVVRSLEQCLEPGGYLFTGHSESLIHGSHGLEYVKPAVYRAGQGGTRLKSQGRSSQCTP